MPLCADQHQPGCHSCKWSLARCLLRCFGLRASCCGKCCIRERFMRCLGRCACAGSGARRAWDLNSHHTILPTELKMLGHPADIEVLPSNCAALAPLSIRTAWEDSISSVPEVSVLRNFARDAWCCVCSMQGLQKHKAMMLVFAKSVSHGNSCSDRQAVPCLRKRTCRLSTCELCSVYSLRSALRL